MTRVPRPAPGLVDRTVPGLVDRTVPGLVDKTVPGLISVAILAVLAVLAVAATAGGLEVEIVESDCRGPGYGERQHGVGQDGAVHRQQAGGEVDKEKARIRLNLGQLIKLGRAVPRSVPAPVHHK